ncbi:MAG: purine-binding chemotaxis protein CheW [Polyangiaceae bacterium]|nr:purine-binding chemotaxis protein CheW [Polyangiaceae bacterium]
MADLVRSRARGNLARRGAPIDRGPRTEFLAFRLGDDVYAGPVALIREILKPPPLTPVPRAPFAVMGIVSVRGQLVTVIDLRRRLRLPESAPTRRARVLLVNPQGTEVLGLYVDEVLQVYRLADNEIEHAAAALGGEVAPYIAGIARPIVQGSASSSAAPTEASLVILLELRSLLAS